MSTLRGTPHLADDTGDLTTALGSPGTRRVPAPEEAAGAG